MATTTEMLTQVKNLRAEVHAKVRSGEIDAENAQKRLDRLSKIEKEWRTRMREFDEEQQKAKAAGRIDYVGEINRRAGAYQKDMMAMWKSGITSPKEAKELADEARAEMLELNVRHPGVVKSAESTIASKIDASPARFAGKLLGVNPWEATDEKHAYDYHGEYADIPAMALMRAGALVPNVEGAGSQQATMEEWLALTPDELAGLQNAEPEEVDDAIDDIIDDRMRKIGDSGIAQISQALGLEAHADAIDALREQVLPGGMRAAAARALKRADLGKIVEIADSGEMTSDKAREMSLLYGRQGRRDALATMEAEGLDHKAYAAAEGWVDPEVSGDPMAEKIAFAQEIEDLDAWMLSGGYSEDEVKNLKEGNLAGVRSSGNPFVDSAMRRVAAASQMAQSDNFREWAEDRGLNLAEGRVPSPAQISRYMRQSRRDSRRPLRGTGRMIDLEVVDKDLGVETEQGLMYFQNEAGEFVGAEQIAEMAAAELSNFEENPVAEIDLENPEARAAFASTISDPQMLKELQVIERVLQRDPSKAAGMRAMVDRTNGRVALVGPQRRVAATTQIDSAHLERLAQMTTNPEMADVVGSVDKLNESRTNNGLTSEVFASMEKGSTIDPVTLFVPKGALVAEREPVKTKRVEVARTLAGDRDDIFRGIYIDEDGVKREELIEYDDLRAKPAEVDLAESGLTTQQQRRASRRDARQLRRAQAPARKATLQGQESDPVHTPYQTVLDYETPSQRALTTGQGVGSGGGYRQRLNLADPDAKMPGFKAAPEFSRLGESRLALESPLALESRLALESPTYPTSEQDMSEPAPVGGGRSKYNPAPYLRAGMSLDPERVEREAQEAAADSLAERLRKNKAAKSQ
ncbi:MAG: hypothetical protein P1V36_00220 [Planctomycetota bacterium]|nr:hypothetical protein [Planctomycetota bacterium]